MSTRTRKLRSSKKKLSEIEGCVLGLLAVDGPATPYAIRKVFLESPNPQWSGSAGTIYPLIARLLRRKLIRSKVCLTGKRRGHRISVTPSGTWALEQWLSVPIPEWWREFRLILCGREFAFSARLGTNCGSNFLKTHTIELRRT
jgi:DNA-binding PadR family transcriptional regulator